MKKYFIAILIVLSFSLFAIELDINSLELSEYIEYLKEKDAFDREERAEQIERNDLKEKNYLIRQLVSDEIDEICELYYTNQYYLEAHLGVCYLMDLNPNETYNNDNDTTFAAVSSLKYNIINPKMPFASKIIYKIKLVKEIIETHNLEMSEATIVLLNNIQKECEVYNKTIIKRFGIGLSTPFIPERFSEDPYGAFLGVVDAFVSVDITDYICLQVGMDVFDFSNVYFGITFDISSPVITGSHEFFYFLREFLDI